MDHQPAVSRQAVVQVLTEGLSPVGAAKRDGFVPHECRCPITGELMADPVVADDGRSYEREQIVLWFSRCRERGEPLTSPLTRQEIGYKLTPNIALKQVTEQLLEHCETTVQLEQIAVDSDEHLASSSSTMTKITKGTIHELGEIFEQLDPLRELLSQCLDGWQPPALVVVGNEKSGKSTQLERLCMMPMFPHDERICTRMPIQVRLRRGPPRAPRLEVFNVQTNQREGEIIDVPLESAKVDVREAMDRLVTEQNGAISGVSLTHTIILHVQSPKVPNLDLVDLPGVVVNPAVGEPDDMPRQTCDLVNQHIDKHKSHSMFLCTVDATTAPNSSKALQLLRDKGVLDKTIGVITMCDLAAAPQQKKKVLERLDQKGDAVKLEPHGYVATVNAKSDDEGMSNLQKLEKQAADELTWFGTNGYQDKVDAGQATCVALLDRCNTMFIDYIRDSWAPTTLQKLEAEKKRLQDENIALGLPAAFGRFRPAKQWLDELRPAAAQAVTAALEKELPWLLDQFSEHMTTEFEPSQTFKFRSPESAAQLPCVTLPLQDVDQGSSDLESALPVSTTLPMHGRAAGPVEVALQQSRDQVTKFCKAVNQDEKLLEWLRTALKREDSPFKLSRFPQIIEAFVEEASRLLGGYRAEFEAAVNDCISKHLDMDGASVKITHDWKARPMTSTLQLDRDRIIGAITELYAPPRLHILQHGLQWDATDVLKKAIDEDTEDHCNQTRMDLLSQIDHIDVAIKGIRAIIEPPSPEPEPEPASGG